jgi:hypothetical protein
VIFENVRYQALARSARQELLLQAACDLTRGAEQGEAHVIHLAEKAAVKVSFIFNQLYV